MIYGRNKTIHGTTKLNIKDAVHQMVVAARGLRPFIQHTCDYDWVATPDGDVCPCGCGAAIRAADDALDRLRRIARRV